MLKIQRIAQGPERLATTDQAKLPHVLFVVDGFPKALGGGERVVLRLAELLPRYGFRASILTFRVHPESSFRVETAPCPVYLLPLRNTFAPQSLRGVFALRSFLREENVQVVQTFFESSDLWAGLVTRLVSRAKLVWSRRDMGILRRKKHRFAYRMLRRLPHAVVAVSASVAQHVVQEDRVPAGRVHIVHNGLDLDTSDPVRNASGASGPVITTIGNIRRVKGHDMLVQSAPQVLSQFPLATFTVAGEVLEPDFFLELKAMAAKEGVADKFVFLGKITDLRQHLHNADIFVLPSRSEGFSNALLEAMAAGLPCVATDVGGNAEAVQNGDSGLIVSPEDPSGLSRAILQLLKDPCLAKKMAESARRSAQANFSSDAMLQKTTALYKSLLQTGTERRD